MPENINDTPATQKQNRVYLEDKENPEGKPYSRKQVEANAAATGCSVLYKKSGSKIFEVGDIEQAMADGWEDTPFVNHNAPDEPPREPSAERDILMAEAKALGLNPHHKSGTDKLRAMIADHG